MVHARLHLICGNCGCNDMWKWKHIEQAQVEGDIINDEDVSLTCENCATIHSINDNAEVDEDELTWT